jgi:hypothetical protein
MLNEREQAGASSDSVLSRLGNTSDAQAAFSCSSSESRASRESQNWTMRGSIVICSDVRSIAFEESRNDCLLPNPAQSHCRVYGSCASP